MYIVLLLLRLLNGRQLQPGGGGCAHFPQLGDYLGYLIGPRREYQVCLPGVFGLIGVYGHVYGGVPGVCGLVEVNPALRALGVYTRESPLASGSHLYKLAATCGPFNLTGYLDDGNYVRAAIRRLLAGKKRQRRGYCSHQAYEGSSFHFPLL